VKTVGGSAKEYAGESETTTEGGRPPPGIARLDWNTLNVNTQPRGNNQAVEIVTSELLKTRTAELTRQRPSDKLLVIKGGADSTKWYLLCTN
jgi:hypothetical protein